MRVSSPQQALEYFLRHLNSSLGQLLTALLLLCPIISLSTGRMLIPVVFTIIGAFIGISQSAGIGGGPILNICLMMGLGYETKEAMALTYIFLMGGSLGSILQNYPKKRSDGFPLMDFELIEMTLPMTLSGSIFGVMLNHFISDLIITIMFTILLAYLFYISYHKYKESTQPSPQSIAINNYYEALLAPDTIQPTSHPILQSIIENQKSSFPKEKLKVVVYIVLTTLAILLLRGSTSFESLVGVSPCGVVYWILNILHLSLSYLFAKSSAIKIFKIQEEKEKFGYHQSPGQKMTAAKFRSSMFYGFLAGTVGGALGLGGAIILVPVWLNSGLDKNIAAASSPPLIFLSSFISFFVSALSGRYTLIVFLQYFTLSFFSSVFVKWFISYVSDKFSLKSMVYILLMFTMGVSLVALLPFQYYQFKQDPIQFLSLGRFC